MGAQILIAAFTGCLFALISVALVGFQIARWMFKRWIVRSLPEIIQNMMSGQYGPSQHMADLTSAIDDIKAGVVRCGTKCGVVATLELEHMGNVGPVLTKMGWKFDPEKFDGYGCPACVAKAGVDVSGTPPQ